MISKIKKISLFFIVFLILILSFYIIDLKFQVVGKSKEIITSEILDPGDIAPIEPVRCKLELSNDYLNADMKNVDLKIRYNQKMNTDINPTINLSDEKIKYNLEEPKWTDEKTFTTNLIVKDIYQDIETGFLIEGAQNQTGQLQFPFDSIEYKITLKIDTKKPEIEKIIVDLEPGDNKLILYFNEELIILEDFDATSYYFGSELENQIIKVNYEKEIIILHITKINKESYEKYVLSLKEGIIADNFKNTNDNIKFKIFESPLTEIINDVPEIIIEQDSFKITEFEIEPGSSRAIVYFSEGVYSNNNSNLTKNNFSTSKYTIKTINHLAGENKAVLLFNEIITDYDFFIETNQIFNISGREMIKENSILDAKNTRLSLPLIKGWNLISFPKDLDDNLNFHNSLQNSNSLEIYNYKNGMWIPKPINSGITQDAYFIKSNSAQELNIKFKENTRNDFDVSKLQPGWNLVGFPIDVDNQKIFYLEEILTNTDSFGSIRINATNYNTIPFTHLFGEEESPALSPFEGYWLYLENNPTYIGE